MHYSVLLKESIQQLNIKPDGIYVDGTLGRCGHSKEILAALGMGGRLIAFDRDIEAINYAKTNLVDVRLSIIHDNFTNISRHLCSLGVGRVDGIILDLGVSSPQLDDGSRGFSFMQDAALDMRMDNTGGESACEWINRATEAEIADVLWRYGEERFSRRIAHNIVEDRAKNPIVSTLELAAIIARSVPRSKKYDKHPATRSFQAIRIYINNELGNLEEVLTELPEILNIGGRAVIISFHSLEDRIVKTFFNSLATANKLPKWVTEDEEEPNYKVIAKKIKASNQEVNENTRSRSAVMRAIERVR